MEIFLKIAGIILIVLGIVHIAFPRRFNWKDELKPLSLINKQMMVVHTFFIALTVFMMGVLSLFYSAELVSTPFGRVISLGFAIFWFIRLVFQFFVYSKELWKGKTFETVMHIVFTITWIYLTLIYFLAYRSF
ncbi:MAG TPA: hypothetical protein VG961_00470 [Ignavibacteria bacterium]|nr:hypothetical protein [Ignavibacteria bacterium]